jgi:hypothetical protein
MTIEDYPVKFWAFKALFEIEFKRRYGMDPIYSGLSREKLLILFYAFDNAYDAVRDYGRKLGYWDHDAASQEDSYAV